MHMHFGGTKIQGFFMDVKKVQAHNTMFLEYRMGMVQLIRQLNKSVP